MIKQLGLGTVQFGLNYGISNIRGRTSEREVRDILAWAAKNGIAIIDTAAAYGESEAVLGRCLPRGGGLRVVTKTTPLHNCPPAIGWGQWIHEGVLLSLSRLRLASIDAVLVHHVDDLLGPSGDEVYNSLLRLKDDGHVKRIGFSAYTGEQVDAVLRRYDVDIAQVPVNVFDQRMVVGGQLRRLQQKSVEVHVRSVFLQGLLLLDPQTLPRYFDSVRSKLASWNETLRAHGLTPVQGALAFTHSIEANVILVGVESLAQLESNARDFAMAGNCDIDFSMFALNDDRYVNPSRWKAVV